METDLTSTALEEESGGCPTNVTDKVSKIFLFSFSCYSLWGF